ncbi:MAG: hypothetical protein K9G63_01780 [Melioribacteraceae bacterium]|nr:hypothetical protein [Melioribacteraceae bacterium]
MNCILEIYPLVLQLVLIGNTGISIKAVNERMIVQLCRADQRSALKILSFK